MIRRDYSLEEKDRERWISIVEKLGVNIIREAADIDKKLLEAGLKDIHIRNDLALKAMVLVVAASVGGHVRMVVESKRELKADEKVEMIGDCMDASLGQVKLEMEVAFKKVFEKIQRELLK